LAFVIWFRTIEKAPRQLDDTNQNYWSDCGMVFVNTDDNGNITSINVKHVMFPGVEMVAFPRRDKDEN
jgi:hypothetical protein